MDAGIKTTQYSLLRAVAHSPVPIAALADRLATERTTLTRNLRPLIDAGLVAIRPGADARQKIATITPAGRAAIRRADIAWQDAQAELEATLGADTVRVLHGQLDTALRHNSPPYSKAVSMPSNAESANRRHVWGLMLAAAAIMTITAGARQTTGLFVSPINTSTHLGIVSISFVLAVGQFVRGAAQAVLGAVADKFGSMRVIVAGGLLLALGTALTPFVETQWGLMFTLGVLSAAGAGAGSFSILIGATARQIPAERRSLPRDSSTPGVRSGSSSSPRSCSS